MTKMHSISLHLGGSIFSGVLQEHKTFEVRVEEFLGKRLSDVFERKQSASRSVTTKASVWMKRKLT